MITARTRRTAGLALTALGVVYGDIGTSPLYALRECFHGHGVPVGVSSVLGVLSLIFWSLASIVSVKYLRYVLNADNHGEGGILALMALALSKEQRPRHCNAILALGIVGAALLYGDGAITPAISVLGAMEGLALATPSAHGLVVPGTVVILVALFLLQRRGTATVGLIFGPITLLWFVVLALLGMAGLVSAKTLLSGWRYAVVGVFVVAAIVTPPDPISQTLLALPIILLYFASVGCVKVIEVRRAREEQGRDVVTA